VTAAATAPADTLSQDFRVSIINPPGKAAYPIATYTWVLFPEQEDKNEKEILTELLRWMLTLGQKKYSALGYAPLPMGVARYALESLDEKTPVR
jgi:phosphate transport system substrate-binding protein